MTLVETHGVSKEVARQFYNSEMGRGYEALVWLLSSPENLAKQLAIAEMKVNPTPEYLEEQRQIGEFQRDYQRQHQSSTAEWRR